MKNFGLLILGIILGALAMYYYTNKDLDVSIPPISQPSGIVTPDEMKAMDQAYNVRYAIINDSLFKDSKEKDNRSSWYKLEDIENYLVYAKDQAKSKGYILDGLRVYLGAYPDTNSEKGLTTLFFSPTGYMNKSEGSVFFLQDGGDDIPGANGLNRAGHGHPPSANYPQ